jgi:hypothetical protein
MWGSLFFSFLLLTKENELFLGSRSIGRHGEDIKFESGTVSARI